MDTVRISQHRALACAGIALLATAAAVGQAQAADSESGSAASAAEVGEAGESATAASADADTAPPVFRHALDDEPLEVPLPKGEELTEAVERFHQTGENIYVDDADAIVAGEEVYKQFCQACHLPDATGRIGPNLVDEEFAHPRVETDIGLFEVIYGGAAGAMQAFGDRIPQDEILQTIAFLRSLQAPQE